MGPSMSPLISFRSAYFSYDNRLVLENINLDVAPRSMTAVVGPNGAGKSTFLQLIAGQLEPGSGTIQLNPDTSVAYMPQSCHIDRSFPLSVFDVVAMGLWSRVGSFKAMGKAEQAKIQEALENVGLEGFEQRHISELSGGQFQRVLFARLYLEDADVILLDEPFAAIDHPTTLDLIKLLISWNKAGKTILCVTHDLRLVRDYFENILVLSKTVIGHGRTSRILTQATLEMIAFQSVISDEAIPQREGA